MNHFAWPVSLILGTFSYRTMTINIRKGTSKWPMGIQYDYIMTYKINQLIKSSTNTGIERRGMHFKEFLQRENT